MVQLFLLGIIAYVGTEQSLADWMSQFLSTYHHFSPAREGAHAVGLFWGLMSIGALNSVSRHHGAFSGILCTGILGARWCRCWSACSVTASACASRCSRCS